MLASCAEATTAKVDGGQQERAADGAEEGSPSDLLCFCHFDHLCENSVISTGITFVTSTNIAAIF